MQHLYQVRHILSLDRVNPAALGMNVTWFKPQNNYAPSLVLVIHDEICVKKNLHYLYIIYEIQRNIFAKVDLINKIYQHKKKKSSAINLNCINKA